MRTIRRSKNPMPLTTRSIPTVTVTRMTTRAPKPLMGTAKGPTMRTEHPFINRRWRAPFALCLAVSCALWLGACGPDDHGEQAHDDHAHEEHAHEDHEEHDEEHGEHENDDHGHEENEDDGHGHEEHEDHGHGHEDHGHGHDHGDDDSWAITAWGSHFEIFPETGALIVGETVTAHVHVTRLEDFSPPASGTVAMILRSAAGEQVFRTDAPARPGVFNIDVEPSSTGEFDLAFRVDVGEIGEEIRGGRVRVGDEEEPGGLLVAPAPKGGDGGEPVQLSKEQQWNSEFATSWVRRGELARSVEGLVRVRPPAGGERLLSSPLPGIVDSSGPSWPYPGQRIQRGEKLLRITPLVAAEHSLAELEAEAQSLAIEKAAVGERLTRLEELLALEAASRREVEEVRHHAEILEARHAAAERDLEAARATRLGGSSRDGLELDAPFDGEVAAVHVSPGATIEAGETLARIVRTDAVWLEALLSPTDAAQLTPGQPIRGLVLTPAGRAQPFELNEVRLVSVSPEASERTGKVTAFFETGAASGAPALGTTVDGMILLDETRSGIVVPSTALVDDGGVSVVYLQLSGESFLRQPVRVLERQGTRVLVDGLEPGQRLVHRGGETIRRSSLMSSGEVHGHVH